MALIEAKDAAGAMLPGSPGTRVDSNGYAILPYLRPYRINAVEIDPKGSHDPVIWSSSLYVADHQQNPHSLWRRPEILRDLPGLSLIHI